MSLLFNTLSRFDTVFFLGGRGWKQLNHDRQCFEIISVSDLHVFPMNSEICECKRQVISLPMLPRLVHSHTWKVDMIGTITENIWKGKKGSHTAFFVWNYSQSHWEAILGSIFWDEFYLLLDLGSAFWEKTPVYCSLGPPAPTSEILLIWFSPGTPCKVDIRKHALFSAAVFWFLWFFLLEFSCFTVLLLLFLFSH